VNAGAIVTRPADERDADWIRLVLAQRWGETRIVTRDRIREATGLPAIVAERAGARCGLATFAIESDGCELVTLDALIERAGVGTALLAGIEQAARAADCRRVVLITSNDNLAALMFYQKHGYRMVAVHVDAITRARAIKPSIPMIGLNGVPIRDEIELEKRLETGSL
jgi:GNAT superfamily N-acetyltransferase